MCDGRALPGLLAGPVAGWYAACTCHSRPTTSTAPAPVCTQVWEGHIVSASLDGLIKIWEPADPSTGLVVNPQPIFTFPEQVGGIKEGGPVHSPLAYRLARGGQHVAGLVGAGLQ